jgi:exodeoxyribonuclease-5
LPFAQRRRSDEFDFGYVLTVHKAQGSQWNAVMLFDESFAFRENRARWLYTGITRAAARVTVVR